MAEESEDAIEYIIFKYVKSPKNLTLSSKAWSHIGKNANARAEWIIYHYGRAQALFHAVRLGPSFVNVSVVQAIIKKRGILSRYFIQKLLLHYGSYDLNLIELKLTHNIGQIDLERIRSLKKNVLMPWASNLQLSVLTYFLTVAQKLFKTDELCIKGNDMELFHFLTGGPHSISDAQDILQKNINAIKDLIQHMKFIPFPPRPLKPFRTTRVIPEEYPPKDGYENNRQLNIIGRAILICKDLVLLWKEIGYYEICNDVNDLVMQGALLIFYPPNPSADWVQPDVEIISKRLTELLDLGFQLSYTVIGSILYLFEDRLEGIGETLVKSFISVKQDSRDNLLNRCLIETLRPKHSSNKPQVWNFLYKAMTNNPEVAFTEAFYYYLRKNEQLTTEYGIRKLSLPSNFYNWILIKFGLDAQITRHCFEDILKARVSIDSQLQQNGNADIPNGISQYDFHTTCNIFKIYCNAKNFYLPSYLDIISHCTSQDILAPLFRYYLPDLFNVKISFDMPMQIIEDADGTDNQYCHLFLKQVTEKRNEQILKEWNQALYNLSINNTGRLSDIFRNYLHEFIYQNLPNSENV
ncbi:12866_t:CDS:1 [Cetraspora pellucida]|uniref:12866_t:CDS:1 n=1 Tax=Cetraspora pellucida TaxID=1433469 RepID=A0ACA9L9S1_9GLOM|nr:12866_t:CDS:1 [Cetraspora pellucida]